MNVYDNFKCPYEKGLHLVSYSTILIILSKDFAVLRHKKIIEKNYAQSVEAVEYTGCFSAEG